MSIRQKGQGLAEYGLILALVSVVAIGGLSLVGGAIGNTYSNVLCAMDNTNGCSVVSANSNEGDAEENSGNNGIPLNDNDGSSSNDDGNNSAGNNDDSQNNDDPQNNDDSSGSNTSDNNDNGNGGTLIEGEPIDTGGNDNGGNDNSNDAPVGYRYFRLVAESEVNGNPWTSIAELNLVDNNGATIDQSGWSLHYTDSQETSGEDGHAINAFDGNNNTFWHTQWQGGSPSHNHEIQIDLGEPKQLTALRYLPRQSGENGRVAGYVLYVSDDGTSWTQVANGTFPNSATEQMVNFDAGAQPDVCATVTVPVNAVFQLEGFSGSSVTDLSGSGNDATQNGSRYTIANSVAINTGSYTAKTLGVRFTTGGDVNGRQVIYEQGGGTRGINVYIDGAQLYIGIWNRSSWDTRYINTYASPNTAYSVVLVYNSPSVNVYVNGQQIGSFNDLGDLPSHSGGIGVMGMNSNTYYHSGNGNDNAYFGGSVHALTQWNTALAGDDLNTLQTYLDCAS